MIMHNNCIVIGIRAQGCIRAHGVFNISCLYYTYFKYSDLVPLFLITILGNVPVATCTIVRLVCTKLWAKKGEKKMQCSFKTLNVC